MAGTLPSPDGFRGTEVLTFEDILLKAILGNGAPAPFTGGKSPFGAFHNGGYLRMDGL